MCGIAGIANLDGRPVAAGDLRRMCAALSHRGPDDEGLYLAPNVGLGMRRLSIIDLATGRQPVCNEDGTVWAVFNGEIYNFQELRRGLEARGHSFYTASDTEVIVHLYEERGAGCVEDLRGMFAFAVWDEREQRLLLARDRVGIKPLYYWDNGGRLAFASELKALLELSEIERRVGDAALGHLFTFLTTPAAESIVEGVHKLEPGMVLTASSNGVHVSRYWDLQWAPDRSRTEADLVEELRWRLEESVRLHMVADVPLGAFLSGGVDSSAVVATMARLSPRPVKTFSIGFVEDEYNELDHARRVARAFGTEHHELVLEADVVPAVEELAWDLDEPFGDSSALPTYMVSKLAAEHVKVVLSGDGGDELFGGYDRYLVEERERRLERLLAPIRRPLAAIARLAPEGMKGRRFLRHMSLAGSERYIDAVALFRREEHRELFHPDVRARLAGADPWRDARAQVSGSTGHWLSALQDYDIKGYLPLDILTKVDRMSMAHSIEARVPLLDHELLEFAATIPPELRLRGGSGKYIFKQALRGVLPDQTLDRSKRGFAVPLARWLRGPLSSFVDELLLSEKARQRRVFNPDYVKKLVRRNRDGRELDLHLWTLISFELWARRFLDEPRRPAMVAARTPLVRGPLAVEMGCA